MPTYGPLTAGTVVGNDTTLGGAVSWVNTTETAASDNSRASCALNSGQTGYTLKLTNFGFTIGAGETIDGIEVTVERRGIDDFSNARGIRDSAVRLVKGGTIQTPDKSNGTDWSTSGSGDNTVTFGGAADLWIGTWADTDIEGSTFGFAIQATNPTGGSAYAQIDYVTITVYTSAAATKGMVIQRRQPRALRRM